MGKREINIAIKTINQMLEITNDKKQRTELTKILKQYKQDWQELDDKASKRKPKKQVVKVAPVVQDDNYKPKKITIEQKERKLKVDIKSAIIRHNTFTVTLRQQSSIMSVSSQVTITLTVRSFSC